MGQEQGFIALEVWTQGKVMANRLLHLRRDDHDFLVISRLAKNIQHARIVLGGEIAHLGALDFNTTQANATHERDDGDVPRARDGC